MLDDYTCVITGHSPVFVFDLRDGNLSQLARPTVQDVLEYAAEHHHVHCPCALKIGGRAWYTSIPVSKAADCEWATVASEPLPVDTSLDALPGASSPSTIHLVIASEQSSPVDYLRLYREKVFTPYRVEDSVAYKRAGVSHTLPSAKGVSFEETCSTPGSIFVDKTEFLRTMLSKLACTRVNILRRPKGFGKTTFLSMFDAYFDPLSTRGYFPFTFAEDMSRLVFAQRSQLLVLTLDFADLSFDDTMGRYSLEAECDRFMDAAAQQFYLRYQSVLSAPEEEMSVPNASATFVDILRWIQLDNWKLCFTVDNYTAPFVLLDNPHDIYIYKDAINKHIFGRLSNLLDVRVILYGLIVGDDLAHCSPWVGLPIVFTDLSSTPAYSEAFGFSLADVAALGQAIDVDLVSALEVRALTKSTADAVHIYASADILSLARQALNPHGFGQPAPDDVRAIAMPLPVAPVEQNPVAVQMQVDPEPSSGVRFGRNEKDGSWFIYPDDSDFLSESEDDGEADSIGRSPGLTTDASSSASSSACKQDTFRSHSVNIL